MRFTRHLIRWISGLALFFALGTQPLFAANKVVLLTAIDEPSWVLSKLSKIFLRSYGNSGYDVVIQNRADESTLRKYLTASDVVGLFWVSHASQDRAIVNAMDASSTILDIDQNNVKDLFTTIDPNIRFVGIVGCQARPIIMDFRKKGYYANNPSLQLWGYDQPVDAFQGLQQMVRASADFLSDPNQSGSPQVIARHDLLEFQREQEQKPEPGSDPYFLTLRITRQPTELDPDGLSEARVEVGNRVLAILPALKPGEKQEEKTSISWQELLREGDFNIKIHQDLKGFPHTLPIGAPVITDLTGNLQWKPFSTKSGRILGISQHLYLAPPSLGPDLAIPRSRRRPERSKDANS